MKLFITYLKSQGKRFLLPAGFILIYVISFLLYRLPKEVLYYTLSLFLLAGTVVMAADFRRFCQKHTQLLHMLNAPVEPDYLPETDTGIEQDYQNIICLLAEEQKTLAMESRRRYADMIDYYTMWVHQIKTPIASMSLTLRGQDTDISRALRGDLQKIEQYVEMVLCYLRLDSDTTDYVIKELELDAVVRQAVKRMTSQFIGKKISLSYEPLCTKVLTDEKWLLFVVEQVLSNALKYTKKGQIMITLEEPQTLCISDTGIGIAAEDLPRIFEKGFTGFNGREDKKSTGLGLYLCKRICQNLGHRITAESAVDHGTTIRIFLDHINIEAE